MKMNDYQTFIALSRYARWIPEKKRRETWVETVSRYFDFFEEHLQDNTEYILDVETRGKLESAILKMKIMPSMRCLMTAGKALKQNNIAGYNCAYLSIDHPKAFDEVLYILMHGTGVGFSVERQFINKLPHLPKNFGKTDDVFVVKDSKEGWQTAYRKLIRYLYDGEVPNWDVSKIREKGSRLQTFGGRASGPEPLVELFIFTISIFKNATGSKLTSYECHRICCKIAEIVVVGGVRRSALLSLSNLTDERMRRAKSGQWWKETPEMALSNNSVCYTEKPDIGIFMKEWLSLYESKSGERGIFNRKAANKKLKSISRKVVYDIGCNPCSEIILRDGQFCNLTEVIIRTDDTEKTILYKIELATILGTFQASLTNITGLKSKWVKNTVEEALLGVSLTGIMDNPFLNGSKGHVELISFLKEMKKHARKTNIFWAEKIGINPASANTCVKPSGTVSQLVDSASGIHARYSEFYIRTVRADTKDPICRLMIAQGVPNEACVLNPDSVRVFSFPIKSPKNAIVRNDKTAIEQLEIWKIYDEHYCEHKPSVTINVKENEWLQAGSWVYQNFDAISGISFLPHSNHVYKQAPYQAINEAEYIQALEKMPKQIDWAKLCDFEQDDRNIIGTKEIACSGNSCETVDLI